MLDTARFTNFVAEELGVPVALGEDAHPRLARRHHGAGAVAVHGRTASRCRELLPADKIEELVVRTRNGGAEVVALLKTGSAYYAPSAAAARMAKAVAEDSGEVMPVCAWVDGEYGISGVYLGVEAEIGAERRPAGRRAPSWTETELASLKAGRRGGPRQAGRRRQPLIVERRDPYPRERSRAGPSH